MLMDSGQRCAAPRKNLFAWLLLGMAAVAASPVRAEPWVEVGDRGLRSDIEILVARGLIDGPTTTWPLPAGQFERLSGDLLLANQPEYVQLAAKRVLARLLGEGQPQGLVPEAELRLTNSPNTVHDFGTTARDKATGSAGFVWDSDHFSAGLRVGSQPRLDNSDSQLALDGTYLSFLAGNWQLYGGLIDKWYGPGWTSSLTLSNNARPIPKFGLMRNNPHAFETPWLSWLGPWQFDTFVGVLNGPRIDTNTLLAALRLTLEPVRGLEIGIGRTSELCGKNHSCNPIKDEFHFSNSDSNPNPANDQATVDVKFTRSIGNVSVSPYAQLMNEDTGPFTHANTSYLFGTSLAGPFGHDGAQWRVTAEYTDTIATLNWFSFDKHNFGAAYNDVKYPDGMRYRGRSLGFSLDSDSRLFSLAGLLSSSSGWIYRLVYYRANVNTEQLAGLVPTVYPDQFYNPVAFNAVSAKPVQFDEVEAGLTVPLRPLTLDFAVRGQDNQVFPEGGGKFSAEVGVTYRF